jgi:hypothetical protein
MGRTCAAVVVTATAAFVLVGGALAVPDFQTPRKALYCEVAEAFKRPPGYVPHLVCWRSRNGFTVFLYPRGGAERRGNERALKGTYMTAGRVLPFGQQWWWKKSESGIGTAPRGLFYWCFNRTTGLTCANRVGHGFWLGRTRGVWLF